MTDGSPENTADHPGQQPEISDSHTLTLTTILLVGSAIAAAIVYAGSAIARAAGRR